MMECLNCCVLNARACFSVIQVCLPCHTSMFPLIRLDHTSNCANVSLNRCPRVFIPQEQELILITLNYFSLVCQTVM